MVMQKKNSLIPINRLKHLEFASAFLLTVNLREEKGNHSIIYNICLLLYILTSISGKR